MATSKNKKKASANRPDASTNRARVVAEYQKAQARSERRGRLMVAGAAVVGVVIVAAALVAVGLASGNGSDNSQAGSSGASSQVVKAVSAVPAKTADQVGAGSVQAAPSKISAPALSQDGKPRVVYIGAEYCPYCAAERWPLAVALARFGTFSHLGATKSAAEDVFPNTATLSFHGATYTSKYLSFTAVETTSNKRVNGNYAPLDKLSAADQKLETTYNRPPYTSGSPGGIPFIDLAGRYVSSGASYSPQLLQGKTREQVAKALSDANDPIGQAVDGTANVFTAALCDLTDQKPAQVCTADGVTAAAGKLKGS